jgi:CubicO group peptidase (beta-lactamase class C family)
MKRPPLALCALLATTASNPAANYSALLPTLEEDIRREMSDWNIGGIAVALVDDQRTVYAGGFGEASPNHEVLTRTARVPV